jgi:hypothetical protein
MQEFRNANNANNADNANNANNACNSFKDTSMLRYTSAP